MTDFDRAVLTWLDTASLTDRARNVTLGRTSVGIQSYAELIRGDDSTAAIPVDAIRLDIGLKDTVARAQRRLEDGHPMQLGELPPPPPAPQTLMSARSSATTGPNTRRTGAVPQASSRQSSRQQSVNNNNSGQQNFSGMNSSGNSRMSRNNSQQQQQQVPLSARSGTLASARGEQPSRPMGVPPLKIGTGTASKPNKGVMRR